ncbi:hypothetical protein [uncultured Roseobacter sp.]|uniref:hypothetical protein n=1 Tax=uncultured Roseobacter sp. TaxID=114847 RepID=UPI00260D9257|nr:hypothetical protein [uncultured Roseobacter sp.]
MAPRGQPPVFLERGSYRQRRVTDAVRLLAVLGAVLWMIPLLWPTGEVAEGTGMPMSRALSYVFGVWLLLICIAAALVARMRRMPEKKQDADRDDAP